MKTDLKILPIATSQMDKVNIVSSEEDRQPLSIILKILQKMVLEKKVKSKDTRLVLELETPYSRDHQSRPF
jgi:hypothetical protein